MTVSTYKREVVEMGDRLLGRDGCLNFFAGPTDPLFTAELNFYNVHYASTRIGGLDSVADTIINLPNIPGGKKLIYTNIQMELTALEDFQEKGKTDPLFAYLAGLIDKNNGLWSVEAEKYLLENAKPI